MQVIKDPLKTKGARLTMELTIAGRYMVYVPQGEGVGVSRRLDDKERERLRKEAKALDLGGGGAIIRTAAHGATREDFEREISTCSSSTRSSRSAPRRASAPALVFQEADLSVRVVRDIFSPTSSARSSTTRSSTSGSSRSSPARRPSSSTASSCGRSRCRCSRPTASTR